MEEFIIPRAKLVEIPITSAAVGFFNMPNNLDDLNRAMIVGASVVNGTELTTAPSGNAVFLVADVPKCTLVLKAAPGSKWIIDNVPLYQTIRELNAGHYFIFKKFRWSSSASGIQVLTAGLTVGQSICVVIYYIPLDDRGNEIL